MKYLLLCSLAILFFACGPSGEGKKETDMAQDSIPHPKGSREFSHFPFRLSRFDSSYIISIQLQSQELDSLFPHAALRENSDWWKKEMMAEIQEKDTVLFSRLTFENDPEAVYITTGSEELQKKAADILSQAFGSRESLQKRLEPELARGR